MVFIPYMCFPVGKQSLISAENLLCSGCDGSRPALPSLGSKVRSNGCSKGFDSIVEITSRSSVSSSKLHSFHLHFKKGMYSLHMS
jgi:hypothetical protein